MSWAGNRAFDRCDVKVVEFKDFVFTDSPADWPKDEIPDSVDRPTEFSPDPSEDTREIAGASAVLNCPMTEDDRVNVQSESSLHDTRLDALKSVRKLAGELLCQTCRYSSMSAIEVSQERARLARAEAARLEAITARRQALAELNEADPDFGLSE